MKYIILIISLISINLYSQSNTFTLDTTFTKNQIKNIYYKVKYYETDKKYADSLINLYIEQVCNYEKIKYNDDLIINNQNKRYDSLYQMNKNLENIIIQIEPKWYEDNKIWFGMGIVFTFLLTQTISGSF